MPPEKKATLAASMATYLITLDFSERTSIQAVKRFLKSKNTGYDDIVGCSGNYHNKFNLFLMTCLSTKTFRETNSKIDTKIFKAHVAISMIEKVCCT